MNTVKYIFILNMKRIFLMNRIQLHICTKSFYRVYKQLIPFTDGDYIDLLDREISIEKKKTFN